MRYYGKKLPEEACTISQLSLRTRTFMIRAAGLV